MNTYTLLIDERQLHYIRLALKQFITSDPDEELDDFGADIPTHLSEMLEEGMVPNEPAEIPQRASKVITNSMVM